MRKTNNNTPVLRTKAEQEFNVKFADPIDPETGHNPNYILADNLFMSNSMKKTERNRNVLLIGKKGSRKDEHIWKNIFLANTSMVISDPSGETLAACREGLRRSGVDVRVFDAEDPEVSVHYNPFDYIFGHSEESEKINEVMVEGIVKPISKRIKWSEDPFRRKNNEALLYSLIYCCAEAYSEEREKISFLTIYELLCGGLSNFRIRIKMLQEKATQNGRESLAYNYFEIFCRFPKYEQEDIWNNEREFFQQFSEEPLRSLTVRAENEEKNICLDQLAKKKMALFIKRGYEIEDSPYKVGDLLYEILYSQLLHVLLPSDLSFADVDSLRKVQLYFLELTDVGAIPDFPQFLTINRKYKVGCTFGVRTIGELKDLFGELWGLVAGACDTTIYMGGNDPETCESVYQMVLNGCGMAKLFGEELERIGVEVASSRDVGKIAEDQCIVIVRNELPILANKVNYPGLKSTGFQRAGNVCF